MLRYFSLYEKGMPCPCCGESKMDIDSLLRFDKARMIAGIPFNVNSGYRCPKYNQKFKNPKTGKVSKNHPSGHSLDIKCKTGPKRIKILTGLIKAGFKRIGIRGDFIHADDMDKVESCWLY